jgi:hypothetical protein
MSEGTLHSRLVLTLLEKIQVSRSKAWSVFSDFKGDVTQWDCPPALSDFRPDVYAREIGSGFLVVGEAKTPNDLDRRHTEDQLGAYFEHLKIQERGELDLAVTLPCVGLAHEICRRVRARYKCETIAFSVNGWLLGNNKAFCEEWRG